MPYNEKGLLSISTGTMIRAGLVIVLFVTFFALSDVVLLILTAIVIASAIEPFAKKMTMHHIHRTVAVLVLYLVVISIFGALLFFFLPPLLDDVAQLYKALPQIARDSTLLTPVYERFPSVTEALKGNFSFNDILPGSAGVASNIGSKVIGTASMIFKGFAGFILMIVLSFYLAVQEDGITNFLRLVCPPKHEEYVVSLWKRSRHRIGLWMQGQLLLGVLIGIFVYLGLAIFGIKYALLLGVVAAVFEVIPVFGPIMAAVPGVVVGFSYTPSTGFFVLAFYVIIQQFENHLIYPLVVRKIVGVPPLLVIIALVVGGQLAGFLGIILAVPAVTIIVELVGDFEKHKKSLMAITENNG